MKITHLNSATEIISVKGVNIITDPWLDDGVYYGSWFMYPPYKDNDELLKTVDYIYISHIHPDHLCEKTMLRFDKSTPVLIHEYDEKFLRRKIEFLGFTTIVELPNNERYLLKNEVYINIVAADNCNPEICGKAFGCFAFTGKSDGSNQLDSMCIIDDGEFVLLNTNDCPYPIAYEALDKVIGKYSKIDFLLVGYAGASLYPFAMSDYSEEEMIEAQMRNRIKLMDWGGKIISKVRPRYYMPFAGTYILGGSNWKLNKYSPMPELQDAAEHYASKPEIAEYSKWVLLNSGDSFDLRTETQTSPYKPIDKAERTKYIEEVLSQKAYSYEADPHVSMEDFEDIIPRAVQKFSARTEKSGFYSKTKIFLALPENKLLKIDCSESPAKADIVDDTVTNYSEPYIFFDVDSKLLFRIFKGPRHAHWNNMEIGALLKMRRKPDVYELGIHLAICYLHE